MWGLLYIAKFEKSDIFGASWKNNHRSSLEMLKGINKCTYAKEKLFSESMPTSKTTDDFLMYYFLLHLCNKYISFVQGSYRVSLKTRGAFVGTVRKIHCLSIVIFKSISVNVFKNFCFSIFSGNLYFQL